MQLNDIIDRVEQLDGGAELARDLRRFANSRKLGLVYEESKPEYVRLYSKPVVEGDLVNVLPPRGVMEDMSGDDESDVIWRLASLEDGKALLLRIDDDTVGWADVDNLVAVARFDQTIYCGLTEIGRVERGGPDKPYHTVINGENFHALELLLFPYQGKVDCIYIDPPYNTGAKDWKYNNNYVSGEDAYRHSKWLTFMEDRLRLAKKLLNPENSVLICTIDEKEYLRLGLLLEQMFPEAHIQMVTSVINPMGSRRAGEFSRVDEYLYFVRMGNAQIPDSETTMLDKSSRDNAGSGVRWTPLNRDGNGWQRGARANLFYPLYINPATKVIEHVGKSLPLETPRESVDEIQGLITVWPMKGKEEARWQVGQDTCKELIARGYLTVNSVDASSNTATIRYLTSGAQKKIEEGVYTITGTRPDGSKIVETTANKSERPRSVWHQPSHSSRDYGSSLLNSLIPNRSFPFPKSLYAVEDALRFAVQDKPHALIVDFFSGSGTTAHAVMRLNRQDGGQRRSISVTNNEISFEEAKAFTEQGLRQGDEEWEQRGIARYVTIPRVTAAITGLTPEGESIKGDYKFTDEFPMAEGFKENAVFYDLTYLEPSIIRANLAFDEIAPLLWMRAGSVGAMITLGDTDPDDATFEVTDAYGVLFDFAHAPEFIRECREGDVEHIFVVTDIDLEYRDMCAEFRGKDVKQLYKSYLRSFEIGQDR